MTGFQFTPEDTSILNRYMDEFEQADTQMRNNILEKVMGEIYRLRPGNTRFDKKQAKQACTHMWYIYTCMLTEAHGRKSKSGSIITTLLLIVGRPSSSGDGLQEMCSTMPSVKRSWSLPSKSPDVLQELRNSWGHSSLQPPACGMSYLLKNRRGMQRQQGIGQRIHHQIISNPGKWYIMVLRITPLIHLLRMASATIRGRLVRDFQTQLYKTCGVRTIVLLAYAKEDGTPQVAMYVI
jgi:hypothetical protein